MSILKRNLILEAYQEDLQSRSGSEKVVIVLRDATEESVNRLKSYLERRYDFSDIQDNQDNTGVIVTVSDIADTATELYNDLSKRFNVEKVEYVDVEETKEESTDEVVGDEAEATDEQLHESSKINDPEYKYWVVLDGKILAGNEYKEDAFDVSKDAKESGKITKVYAMAGLKKLGIDPNNDEAWVKGNPFKKVTETTTDYKNADEKKIEEAKKAVKTMLQEYNEIKEDNEKQNWIDAIKSNPAVYAKLPTKLKNDKEIQLVYKQAMLKFDAANANDQDLDGDALGESKEGFTDVKADEAKNEADKSKVKKAKTTVPAKPVIAPAKGKTYTNTGKDLPKQTIAKPTVEAQKGKVATPKTTVPAKPVIAPAKAKTAINKPKDAKPVAINKAKVDANKNKKIKTEKNENQLKNPIVKPQVIKEGEEQFAIKKNDKTQRWELTYLDTTGNKMVKEFTSEDEAKKYVGNFKKV